MGKFFLFSWLDSFKRGRGQIPFYPQVFYFQRLMKLLKVRHQSGRFGLQHAYSNRCTGHPERSPTALGIYRMKNYEEMTIMKTLILNSLNRLHKDEAGQGLVEYLLILALVAFAATAGMTTLASGLNSAFSKIGTILGSYIT